MDESRAKTLDTVAVAALIALWAQTLESLPSLPDMVATRFAFDGYPAVYGSKFVFLILPVVATFMWSGTWLALRTGYMKLNVPFAVPEDRIAAIRPLYEYLQRLVRVELLVGFVALQSVALESARNDRLVSGFAGIIGAIIVVTIALVSWFIYRVWTIARGGPSTGSG